MNEHLRERILRKLETLSDDRGYQVLDYVEFEAESLLTKLRTDVETAVRAGRLRTSWHVYNTADDVDRTLDVLSG